MPSHASLRPRPRRRDVAVVGALVLALVAVVVLVLRPGGDDDGMAATSAPRAASSASAAAPSPSDDPAPAVSSSPPPPPRVRAGAAPRLASAPIAGDELVAKVERRHGWTPGVRFAYQWFVDGRRIAGAVTRAFVPGDELIGRQVSVRVTGRRPGYLPAVSRSKARTIRPDNPLAGGKWAVYRGPWNGIYPAYERAGGEDKQLLGRIALQPRVIWFTSDFSTGSIRSQLDEFIAEQQAEFGHDALIQIAVSGSGLAARAAAASP